MSAVKPIRGVGIEQTTLDRLVDGELDGARRAELLRELDGEPDGWKRCALAFLEAQSWREAVAVEIAPVDGVPRRVRGPSGRAPYRQAFGIAAAVFVAFGAGFVARGPRPSDGNGAAGSMLAHRPEIKDSRVDDNALPLRRTEPPATAVPEYLRRQMERQGYQVNGDRKMVPVALEDGRKVAVPVETVSLRYVGRPIH